MELDAIIRVSRVGYRDENLRSDIEQEADIREWAKRHGHTIKRVHVERDTSGRTTDRPALNEAKKRALDGETDGIIAAYLTRFTRHTGEGLKLVQDLLDADKRFIPLDIDVDPTTPTGEYVLTIMLGNAWREWRERQAGFNKARRSAIARGVHLSERFGYRKPQGGGRLIPDPVEAPIVPMIFERRANGAGWQEIADWLNAERIKPHRFSDRRDGKPTRRRTAEAWRHTAVKSLIESRVYLGEAHSGESLNGSAHDALVTRELWDRANGLRDMRPRRGAEAYSLTGILYSELSGHPMTGSTDTKRGKPYRYYAERSQTPKPKLTGKVNAGKVEAIVHAEFERVARTIRVVAKTRTADLDGALGALAEAKGDRDRTAANLDLQRVSPAGYLAAIVEAEDRVNAAATNVQAARESVTGITATDAELVDWSSLPVDRKRRLYAEAFDRIIVAPDRASIRIFARGEYTNGDSVGGRVLVLA